jgi:hypothetical protein
MLSAHLARENIILRKDDIAMSAEQNHKNDTVNYFNDIGS